MKTKIFSSDEQLLKEWLNDAGGVIFKVNDEDLRKNSFINESRGEIYRKNLNEMIITLYLTDNICYFNILYKHNLKFVDRIFKKDHIYKFYKDKIISSKHFLRSDFYIYVYIYLRAHLPRRLLMSMILDNFKKEYIKMKTNEGFKIIDEEKKPYDWAANFKINNEKMSLKRKFIG